MDNRTSIIKDPILSGKIDGKFNLRETSPRIPGKTSNFQGQGTTVFRKPNFRSAKVIRQLSPYSKFKEIKYLFESPVIQDDYAPNLENLAPKPGLDGINRHKGCISAHTNTSAHAEISGIYFQREPVHVQCTTLRTNYSPLYLHPSNELPNISAAKKGSVCPSILGRSDTLGRITRRTKEVGTTNSANFGKAGVHSELREVPINPLSRLSVARDKMDPELVSDGINSAVSGTSKRIGKSCSSDEAGIATTNRIVTGSNSICMPNTTTGKTACPQTTKDIEHSDWNTKRRANPAATRLDKCSPMVDKPCELENQSLHQKPFTQRSSIYRCIKCRVWSPYRLRFLYSRTMVKGRYAVAHKFQRTLGFSSSCGIRYHPRKRYNCSVYRQYCSLLLHKKSRLESFSCVQKLTERLFQTVEEKELLLVPSHLAGLLNVTADALSRDTVLPTEWSLNQETFQDLLCQIDFVPEVDAMATPWNAQLQQFICPFPHPLASGRDFFLTKLECWKSMYIFPPPKTLLKVLEKMNNYQGRAIVIAPNTPAQPWFPILRQKASRMLRLLHPPQQEVQGIIHRHCIQSCSHFHAWIL